ncbi:formylglycine-generating enzyme family protein, partial [Fibrobacterota bacterium]
SLILKDSSVTPSAYIDTLYVYADPWGGRHFDSVTVELFCRESCLVLFSLEDSVNLVSYSEPINIRRNQTVWIAGVDEIGNQSRPIEIKYVIEKQSGKCPEGMKPFGSEGGVTCMDKYEWPNKEGEWPSAYVTHKEAIDSCALAGKRLCTMGEWQLVCSGPEHSVYPYGNRYNENYCPAKEQAVNRSGRFPACRSYFGIFDMPGNLWEWTGTESSQRTGYFMVAGGNWTTGDQATCRQTKYSFFPQNRYLFVGFRCCSDVD